MRPMSFFNGNLPIAALRQNSVSQRKSDPYFSSGSFPNNGGSGKNGNAGKGPGNKGGTGGGGTDTSAGTHPGPKGPKD